jgi:hypothetical protein
MPRSGAYRGKGGDERTLLRCVLDTHPLANVWRLRVNGPDDGGSVDVKAVLWRAVADIIAEVPYDLGHIKQRIPRNLAADVQQAHRHVALAGNTRKGILPQAFVQHDVGYLVTELVWMTFRNRFRCEKHVPWIH